MVEILAPAGNKESFLAAINNGANAVYLGLSAFSARQSAENFTKETLSEVICYAHLFNVKVYVALNTLTKDSELPLFFQTLQDAINCGADAIILQDLFMGKIIKERYPNVTLHLSTQAGVNNVYGAILAKEYGFSRVITARETTLEDILEISKVIETEVFIQGALCTAFSGQCYMSSFIGGNSGNRGLCKQPCRKKYTYFVDNNKATDGYALSFADLSVKEDIKKLIEVGVTSFKIEGRMRRPEYVSAACQYYNKIINNDNADISILRRVYNRGDYTKGITFNDFKGIISSKIQNHKGEYVGKITKIIGDQLKINTKITINEGDCFKLIDNNGYEVGNATAILKDNKIIIKYLGKPSVHDNVNITTDVQLNKKLLSTQKLAKVYINGTFICGEKAKLTAACNNKTFTITGDICQKAINNSLDIVEFTNCMNKVDNYPFDIVIESFNSNGVFMPKSQLNKYRRDLYSGLFNLFNNSQNIQLNYSDFNSNYITHNNTKSNKIAIISNHFNFDLNNVDCAIFFPDDYNDTQSFNDFFNCIKGKNITSYLYLPPFANKKDLKIIENILPQFSGIYAQGYYSIKLAEKYNKKLLFGTGLNIFNNLDISLANSLNAENVISKELSYNELKHYINSDNYVFTLGKTILMNLIYCPFSKNCVKCKANSSNIILEDEQNRRFFVRKYKLSDCRFEVYNTADLCCGTDINCNKIFNFVSYSKEKCNKILANLDNEQQLKNILQNCTHGNFKRGIK